MPNGSLQRRSTHERSKHTSYSVASTETITQMYLGFTAHALMAAITDGRGSVSMSAAGVSDSYSQLDIIYIMRSSILAPVWV
jgi:hypothetical protein